MEIIKVKNLKKNYGNFTAVENISFNVNRDEIFGFLGHNRAGKTTTINMLIGMAKITGAILFGIFNSIIPIFVSVLYFKASVNNWLLLIAGICFLSIISTLPGLFISVSANEVFEAQTYSNFFRFPMIFLCGLFVPIASLPIILQPLSYMLPVTYSVDLFKYSISGNNFMPVFINIPVIIIFCIILFFFSIYNIDKKWIL